MNCLFPIPRLYNVMKGTIICNGSSNMIKLFEKPKEEQKERKRNKVFGLALVLFNYY